ncbi:hypothetical protein [Cryptosporangium aurantiacum]|uniref:Uncharacterized protein n=1 Tax=Cryptosporangium aurantiacum TaxID=134849 RepID=A0A1M7RLX9_9ACTN|nr:hypothetical protein [Cryptosporangium aurantiacum]SHN47088.1 hypothetical protein SAMN05443668_12044 [Cryptosporangium aurantiacum]
MQPPTSGADPYYPSGQSAYPASGVPASGAPASPSSGYAPTSSFPAAGYPSYQETPGYSTTPLPPPPPGGFAGAPGTYGAQPPGFPPPPAPPKRNLLPLILGIVVALIVVGAGCFGSGYLFGKNRGEAAADSGPRVAATPKTTTLGSASPTAEAPAAQDGVTGTWKGTYTCNQGETGLTLTIEGQDSALTATFEFYPTSSNPNVEKGSYKMGGNVTDGRLALIGTDWIEQPAGYEMVDLSSSDFSGTTMNGTIDGAPGCTTFSVTRS